MTYQLKKIITGILYWLTGQTLRLRPTARMSNSNRMAISAVYFLLLTRSLFTGFNSPRYSSLKKLEGNFTELTLAKTSGIVTRDRGKKLASSWQEHRGKTSTHAPGWAFPVSFSVTLFSQIKVSRARSASFCAQLVVQLFCFMLLVFLTIL